MSSKRSFSTTLLAVVAALGWLGYPVLFGWIADLSNDDKPQQGAVVGLQISVIFGALFALLGFSFWVAEKWRRS